MTVIWAGTTSAIPASEKAIDRAELAQQRNNAGFSLLSVE